MFKVSVTHKLKRWLRHASYDDCSRYLVARGFVFLFVVGMPLFCHALQHISGDFTYDYNLTTKEATLTVYAGDSASVTIPSSIRVSETYKDEDDGETHTRHHTLPVTAIGSSAFRNKTFVKTINFHAHLKTIGDYAFAGCTGISSVETPMSLTVLSSYAFEGCTSLRTATINGTGLSLRNSRQIFNQCGSLERVSFGDGVTELYPERLSTWNQGDYSGTFGFCTNLVSIHVGSGISEVPNYFTYRCGTATDGLTVTFDGTITKIGESAFCNSKLDAINIKISDCVIGYSAFSGCRALTFDTIDFMEISSIGGYAFQNCVNLIGELRLPFVLNIGNGAFQGCTGITAVLFTGSITSLSDALFRNCSNAITFSFVGPPPTVTPTTFQNIAPGAVGIYSGYNSEWNAVISADKTWNGLIMAANTPILSICRYNAIDRSLDISWDNANAPMPSGLTYEIRRGFSNNYAMAEIVTNGYEKLTYTDSDFMSTGGVSHVWYWVKPEHSLFDVSLPLKTRNRHAIAIGLSNWEYAKMPDTGGADNARTFATVAAQKAGIPYLSNTQVLTDSIATTNNVREAFSKLSGKVSPGDICVVFINTHGGLFEDEEENGKYAALSLFDGLYTDEELALDISSIGEQVSVVCMVDACHSGGLYNNDELSSESVAWQLSNGLADCPVNVAWITAADANTSSYSIFSDFLLWTGWREGYAGVQYKAFSFFDLARYTKRQYDGLFAGVEFEGESASKQVQIWNEPLLASIVASDDGQDTGTTNDIPVPSGFVAGKGESRAYITASWESVAVADSYWIFFKFGNDGKWIGSLSTKKTELKFSMPKNDDEFGKYYEPFMGSSSEFPVVFAIRVIGKTGISDLSELANGWIDSSWNVIFDAGQGYVTGEWMGETSEAGGTIFKKTLQRGESLTLTELPNATRSGFVLVGWKTSKGKKASINDVVWEPIQYSAVWTDMTKDWIDKHDGLFALCGGDIVKAAGMMAANGKHTLAECYSAGINPQDPEDDLVITDFHIFNGNPVFTLNHSVDGGNVPFGARLRTLGKKNLGDADWVDITDEDKSKYRFFSISVKDK